MITYRCDGCGKELSKKALRYRVKIDVRAAYDEMEVGLLELVRDHRAEILQLIEKLNQRGAEEIESSVYKAFELDLCPSCHRAYLRDPLRFHPEQGQGKNDVDVDAFLRSLGYGSGEGSGAD